MPVLSHQHWGKQIITSVNPGLKMFRLTEVTNLFFCCVILSTSVFRLNNIYGKSQWTFVLPCIRTNVRKGGHIPELLSIHLIKTFTHRTCLKNVLDSCCLTHCMSCNYNVAYNAKHIIMWSYTLNITLLRAGAHWAQRELNGGPLKVYKYQDLQLEDHWWWLCCHSN